ncbi:hypothetical protein C1E23_17890 [Pseudoalteromonas phenolica]|uniref:MipA/OmpV family protein n=1 Tax=Pseudoalteromonas phenolica TaxID=161398 RepID=A0A4Q7ILA2_9GAMM|nr:MipA/OmpV family protein [Pseudoalteromonas phenolica]RZQ51707.1 hypothetical protein C1E23_17890 [Pseudoalteromonas phenolica]
MKTLLITSLLLCTALNFANAQTSPSNLTDAFNNKRDAGGYFSPGFVLEHQKGLYQSEGFDSKLSVRGAYYFKNGFFLEIPGGSDKFESNFALGYNLFNVGDWEFDALYSSAHGDLNYNYLEDSFEKNSTPYLGLRAIGTISGLDAMFLYGVNTNKSDFSGGHYAAAWLGKSWNIQNWHLFSSVGLQYRNDEILDYYYGVPESAKYHPTFKANGGFNFIYKMGVKRPITENWLLEGFFSYTSYADSIVNSPYTQNILKYNEDRSDAGSRFNVSLHYVF